MERSFLADYFEDELEEREPEEQYIIFSLGDTECAAKVESVREIERMLEVTRVPRTPVWVEGITNLRGNIVTVVDLRSFMGMAHATPSRASRIIVSRAGEVVMGLLVDRVSEIRYLRPSAIRSPGADLGGGLAPYLRGIYQLDGRLLSVIDIGKVLLCDKMRDLSTSD